MCQWSIENKSISAAQLKDEREKLVSLSFKLAFYFAVEAFQFWCLISSLARISLGKMFLQKGLQSWQDPRDSQVYSNQQYPFKYLEYKQYVDY